jgi:hypothetical protein
MKKVILGFSVFVSALAVALPAFAFCNNCYTGMIDVVKVENNSHANVTSNVGSISNSGTNMIKGQAKINAIKTGDVKSVTNATVQANYNEVTVKCSDCLKGIDRIDVKSNSHANVTSNVGVIANTGHNSVVVDVHKPSPCGWMPPGNVSAGANMIWSGQVATNVTATTLVNSNVVKIK